MNVTIRQATTSDIYIISALGITTFYEAYYEQDDSGNLADYVLKSFSLQQIKEELNDENSTFIIAESEEKAVGYAKLRENSPAECVKNENAIELQRIYILEKARGKNVGKQLMDESYRIAREKGYETIWLGVWEENEKAQKFYERLGFERVGELEFPYGNVVGTNFVLKLDL